MKQISFGFQSQAFGKLASKVAIGKLPLPEPIDRYIPSRMTLIGTRSKLQPLMHYEPPRSCHIIVIPSPEGSEAHRMLIA